MYVVIAEDTSDLNCLKILIKRLTNNNAITIVGKGYNCCGDMLNKGAALLKFYDMQKDYRKFIICYDRDKDLAQKRYEQVISKIIKPSGIKKSENSICIVIPTEEIEAWILADIQAVSKVIPTLQPEKKYPNPEEIANPKETLERLSRENKPKPLYSHNTHNEQVMKHINLEVVKEKCLSFVELAKFIESDISNYPKRNNSITV
jgi:hypothetical protein